MDFKHAGYDDVDSRLEDRIIQAKSFKNMSKFKLYSRLNKQHIKFGESLLLKNVNI